MFVTFSAAVHQRYSQLSKHELYTTEIPDLFEQYLSFFPEGSNPVFRNRTEHDCNCCKNFIRRLGSLVAIIDGKRVSVWDNLDLTGPYKIVADKMSALVCSHAIVSVFRTKERKYGIEHNYDSVTKEKYHHFHGDVADRHFAIDPETKRGEQDAIFQVFKRGLTELKTSNFDSVLDLIGNNGLYRGDEHKSALNGFLKLLRKYDGTDTFVWSNLSDKHARFRNTVIGSLLVDLASGVEFDAAVRSFETKVAPANYKRPTAVITQKMVEDAVQKLTDLGLTGAINRRYARLSDISVNDVLFVDNDTRGSLRNGGIAALLEPHTKTTAPPTRSATPITADDFVKTVLPKAKSVSLLVQNRHAGNFVSLTGADGPERPFKWSNNFGWSYCDDTTDSLKRRVAELGGRVDGPFRFTHSWNHEEWGRNQSLMDLHVFFPGHDTPADGKHDSYGNARRVGWNRRIDPSTGGIQDVDHVAPALPGQIPVENISFPDVNRMIEGTYTLKIHNWQLRGITKSGFKAEVEAGGQLVQFEHPKPLANKEWVTVARVELKKGQFTITPVMETTTTPRLVWGVKTETLVPVTIICHSPNHWSGESVGAKHLIFALQNCRNPEPTRGIYNEFLRSDLDRHRKVFEVLGAKTKCQYSEDQVSGLGFTSARGDTVTVVVDGRRSYTISF